MGIFRFKKFAVLNERSAMKVNTDGVLLGAAMTLRISDRNLLDVGTGTGTIALMAAQRLTQMQEADREEQLRIDAVDIDDVSVEEASSNFQNSAWSRSLFAHHSSLKDFEERTDLKYDLIFSNPPYFDCSLEAPQVRRSNARHTSTGLSYRELLEFADGGLTAEGRISLVLPADTEQELCRHARMCGLYLFRILRVRTVPRKSPVRIIAEFSRYRCESPEDTLITIQDEGKYTEEYLSLMHDFYLFA